MQQTIIQAVAPQVSATVLLTILQPDQQGLAALYQYYRQQGQDAPAREVGAHYVTRLEQHATTVHGSEAARSWDVIQGVYAYLGQLPEAAPLHARPNRQIPVTTDCIISSGSASGRTNNGRKRRKSFTGA